MNDDLPPPHEPPSGEPASEQPPQQDPWDARSERRRQSLAAREERSRPSMSWLGGAILILLGVVFLAQNLNLIDLGRWNWWALFILIPAIGALINAWTQYQAGGTWDARARGSLIGGLFLTLVAAAFLFDLDWGKIWPWFLILAGLGVLFSAVSR